MEEKATESSLIQEAAWSPVLAEGAQFGALSFAFNTVWSFFVQLGVGAFCWE